MEPQHSKGESRVCLNRAFQIGSQRVLVWFKKGGVVVKNLPAKAGNTKRHRLYLWVGKMPWSRKQHPIPVFLPGKFHGQRSLVSYSPWGHKESDMTDCAHTCTQWGGRILWSNSLQEEVNRLIYYRISQSLPRAKAHQESVKGGKEQAVSHLYSFFLSSPPLPLIRHLTVWGFQKTLLWRKNKS